MEPPPLEDAGAPRPRKGVPASSELLGAASATAPSKFLIPELAPPRARAPLPPADECADDLAAMMLEAAAAASGAGSSSDATKAAPAPAPATLAKPAAGGGGLKRGFLNSAPAAKAPPAARAPAPVVTLAAAAPKQGGSRGATELVVQEVQAALRADAASKQATSLQAGLASGGER